MELRPSGTLEIVKDIPQSGHQEGGGFQDRKAI
jgi:hypothetical protein